MPMHRPLKPQEANCKQLLFGVVEALHSEEQMRQFCQWPKRFLTEAGYGSAVAGGVFQKFGQGCRLRRAHPQIVLAISSYNTLYIQYVMYNI